MTHFAEVVHTLDIKAPINTVRQQFADLDHHIHANVHPKLTVAVLEKRENGARYAQVVKLLGIRQRDVFERTIRADGSILDESVEGFNKGGSLDFQFAPAGEATRVRIAVRLPVPPLLRLLKPLLVAQVRREVTAAALEDKYDLEVRGYQPQAA